MEAPKQSQEKTSGSKTSSSSSKTISLGQKSASSGKTTNSKSAKSGPESSKPSIATKAASTPAVKTEAKRKSTDATRAGLAIKAGPEKQQLHAMHINQEQRRQLIETAAYLRAEKRGFTGGDPVEDWLQAESEVDSMLG